MVLAKRLLLQVLFLLSILVIVSEVWGATTRKKKSTTKTVKKRIRKSTTKSAIKSTTTSPKTETPYKFCRNYNKIKKNFQDTALSEDFVEFRRDTKTELFDARDLPIGKFIKRGFKVSFESVDKVNFGKAVEACLYRKLQLLAMDQFDDSNFDDNFHETLINYMLPYYEKEPIEFLWTSAAPCSKSDPLDKATNSCSSVTWCSNNVESRLNYTLNLGKFSRPYCIIYRKSTQRLVPADCSLEASFMCESACSKPKCPLPNDCLKDESLFEVIGGKTYLKKEHEIRGTWEPTNFGFYFFGEKLVNWKENWMTCCSLGLKPLALTRALFDHNNDNPNIPMQGVVYWSAMTRDGCLLHFENCLHKETSELLDAIICGVRNGGSCVAVSNRDKSVRQYIGTSLILKFTICYSKLLLGCEGTEKTFDIRVDTSNCDLPECTGLPNCVMKDELSVAQGFLVAPWRFGNWHSCCDNNILELHNEYGTWDEAYKRCCSLGMDLLSVHNPAKQDCLGNPYKNSNPNEKGYLPFRTEAWTAGRDIDSCRGKLRWCTGYLNDYLKNDLTWKKGQDPRLANNSCVFIDFGDPVVPSLALADCSEKKQIICEAPMGVDVKLKMHYQPCRRNFKVKEREAEKIWATGDLNRTSYAAKKMIQCLAEHIGLVYNSTKINGHIFLKMMSRMFYPLNYNAMLTEIRVQDAKSSQFKYLYGEKKIRNFLFNVVYDLTNEYYSAHFDIAAEIIIKLYESREIKNINEETFTFDFLVFLLQSNKAVDRFWKLYDFTLEQRSWMPADQDLSSPCMTFDAYLKNSSSCIDVDGLIPLTESKPFPNMRPIDTKWYGMTSFTACLEKRGSLPFAETKTEFETIYNLIRGVNPTLTIIWGQGFYDMLNENFMWCRSDVGPFQPWAKIPVPVSVNALDATKDQDFVMLVSLPGVKPNLHAVPPSDELMNKTEVFCRFPDYVVNECSRAKQAEREEN
ncbi:Hypothetical predicted protein [Cloeon dipterum]|uniref:C-type lectin domain-containing protein n=1 Tax=Cloeon dipterum TaxID=197152 RepID=A0A8S1DY21_9INSE|nr:Hypothetical predicted protein [Cloeon dipterum]